MTTKIKEIGEQLRSGIPLTAFILMMALGGMVMRPDYRAKHSPPPRDPMALIASPNEPFMFEAIRLAQAPHSEDGPWGGAKRKQGPTATFKTAGGSITLTQSEIAGANEIYPQLVNNPKILYGSSSSRSHSYSEDMERDWGSETQ